MKSLLPVVLGAALLGLVGCSSTPAPVIPAFDDQVDKPVEGYGLFKLDPKDYPDMSRALSDRANLLIAVERSIQYMEAPSSQRFFTPADPISHAQVYAGLLEFRQMLQRNLSASEMQRIINERYEVWSSKGYDWQSRPQNQPGKVWFTAYFTPIYRGSRTRQGPYQYPIYMRPRDLVTDPTTGDLVGQLQPDGTTRPGYYPSRAELMANDAAALRGLELMWFADPMEPYIIQVQGSAKVILTDGTETYIGYNGSNGGEYLGLGTQLKNEGILTSREVSLPNVLRYFREHPEKRQEYINRSKRFVFMKEYNTQAERDQWPSGALGRRVTDTRTLATDKKIFPRASLTFVDVPMPDTAGNMVPTQRILLDQDTGGAIRAAGRADIYIGMGDIAGRLAGQQFSEGHLYYFVMRPELAPQVIAQLGRQPKPAVPARTPSRVPAPPARPSPRATPRTTGPDEMFPK